MTDEQIAYVKIKIKDNLFVLVSPQDEELVNKYNWSLNSKGYLKRHGPKINEKWTKVYLHREILNCPIGYQVDHINGNKLDNRRENLRICTNMLNHYNMPKRVDNKSGVTGVYFNNRLKKWVAEIKANKIKIYIGSFNDLDEAKKARQIAEQKYFGNFRYTQEACCE